MKPLCTLRRNVISPPYTITLICRYFSQIKAIAESKDKLIAATLMRKRKSETITIAIVGRAIFLGQQYTKEANYKSTKRKQL